MRKRYLLAGALSLALLAAGFAALKPAAIPPEVVSASVTQVAEAVEQAWSLPVAATYRTGFIYQSNGSRCGAASLANVLRSLDRGPTTEADVLEGTGLCWTGICFMGLTLDELAGLAAMHVPKTTVLRDLTLDQFREEMRRANDPSRRYVINFAREKIFGAGVGHHSPIGGYLEAQDLVFVLDVNEDFKPWLVETERLYGAMDTLDGDRKRGLLRME